MLPERTWVPAMVTWRGATSGEVTERHLAWYERLAQGQPAVLVLEATGVRDVPSGPLLRLHEDRFVPGLQRLVEVIRRASGGRTRVLIQLIDFLRVRRRPLPQRYFSQHLAITSAHAVALGLPPHAEDAEVRAALQTLPPDAWGRVLTPLELEALQWGARERITDEHLPHIQNLPAVLPTAFATAAKRAVDAGCDGIELHFAHAYTLASFLSPHNTRTDGYGGELGQRLKLPLEVWQAVRNSTPPSFIIGCRYLANECIAGGHGPGEASEMGVAFARAGMDFLSLSRGGKFEDARQPAVGRAIYPYTGASGAECIPPARLAQRGGGQPRGRNAMAAAQVRGAVRAAGFDTPVVLAGGIHTLADANGALQAGHADIIAAARQSLADPLWLTKLREGRANEIRQCTLSNYCEGLDQMHKTVTCKLWDRSKGAAEEPREDDGRRALPPHDW